MLPEVVIGETWLKRIAYYDRREVEWASRWPYGDFEASAKVTMPPGWSHPALRPGLEARIHRGGRLWLGNLASFDRESGELRMVGRIQQANGYYALDATGTTTSVPETAVDAAIAGDPGTRSRLSWARLDPFALDPATGLEVQVTSAAATDDLIKILDLLDAASLQIGKYPHMGSGGVIEMRAQSTTPYWQVRPNTVELGFSDAAYASTILVRFLDASAGGVRATATAEDAAAAAVSHVEHAVDATGLGQITTAKATSIGNAILARALALQFTNSFELTPSTLMGMGGGTGDPTTLKATDVIRVHGARHPRWPLAWVDVVPGEVRCKEGSATVSPFNKEPQTLAEVTEEVMRLAAAAHRWSVVV